MKINEAAKDFFVLTADREEMEILSATLEDHAMHAAMLGEKYSEHVDEYKEYADRLWVWSCDIDRALGYDISEGNEDED